MIAAFACGTILGAHAIKTSDLVWTDMQSFPLHGTFAADASKSYSRLPDSLKTQVREDLWALGLNSAGLYIRFASDASAIGAKFKSLNGFQMNHMTAAGVRGLDLYTLENGQWTTVSSARPVLGKKNTTTMVMTDMQPKMREYMLYLPLYDGVDSIYIGVDSAAVVKMPALDSPRRADPVVMYGTSILQGGCATRPGMVHTSMLGRMLDRQVINLGFSGNAKLDPEIAHLVADNPASVIVLDALPNCTTPMVAEKLEPFYDIIRQKHPATPIVLVESPVFPLMRFNTETLATITEKNRTLAEIYGRLKDKDPNLYYFKGEDVLGDCVEGTVDNYHLTDLGFLHFANAMYPLLHSLLGD